VIYEILKVGELVAKIFYIGLLVQMKDTE